MKKVLGIILGLIWVLSCTNKNKSTNQSKSYLELKESFKIESTIELINIQDTIIPLISRANKREVIALRIAVFGKTNDTIKIKILEDNSIFGSNFTNIFSSQTKINWHNDSCLLEIKTNNRTENELLLNYEFIHSQ